MTEYPPSIQTILDGSDEPAQAGEIYEQLNADDRAAALRVAGGGSLSGNVEQLLKAKWPYNARIAATI